MSRSSGSSSYFHTALGPWDVVAASREEYHHLKQEIFGEETYDVNFDTINPRILDLGSHIGLSCLYWLQHAPQAQITAVEPHPQLFELLEQNIWNNRLEDRITAIQAAVVGTNHETVTLHQDQTSDQWWSTSSLTPSAWNGQQTTSEIHVPAIRLSELMNEPFDLVKMDIEGQELEVLHEAEAQLHLIKQLVVEVHSTTETHLDRVLQILKKQFRSVEIASPLKVKITQKYLPRLDMVVARQ